MAWMLPNNRGETRSLNDGGSRYSESQGRSTSDKARSQSRGRGKEDHRDRDGFRGSTSPHTVILMTGWATEITERGVDPGIEGGT